MEGHSMNERMLELALQAGLKKEHGSDREYVGDFDWRQFAELIIRECVQVGGPEDSYTDEWFKAKADSMAKIKEHFGVEE
jgi:hypothetical protein